MVTLSAVAPTTSVVSDLQMLVAGLTAVIAGQQLVLAHMDKDRTARWLGVVCATLGVTLASNVAILQLPYSGWFEVAMFTRAVAASSFVWALFLFASLAGRRPPLAVLVPAFALAGLRIALWPTDLLFAHRIENGGPVYGPLLAPLNIPLLLLCLAYFASVVLRAKSNIELVALIVGCTATAAIALPSFFVAPALGEELTGWLTVPTVFTALFVVLRRQYGELDGRRRVLGRQAALATLARSGLTAPAHALIGDATRLLQEHPDADTAFATAVSDLTEIGLQRRRAEEDLEYRATHDGLTGLPNRELLGAQLTKTAPMGACSLAVIHLGVDGLRSLNDVYGHAVGNNVLVAFAQRLSSIVAGVNGANWIAARVDGDEFAVAAAGNVDEQRASWLAHELVARLNEPLELPGFRGSVKVCAGVAVAHGLPSHARVDAILIDADIAMFRAKQLDERCVAVFDDSMRADLLRRRSAEVRLARAVEDDEIIVHFQPVVSLQTGQVVAYEALARWQVDGILHLPSDWVPVAESTGDITAIGERVFTLAAAQLSRWRTDDRQIHVAVNVSPRQLLTPQLRLAVEAALSNGMPPNSLCIEVTEGIVVVDEALRELVRLREMGVLIALDDFGTGYSSLAAISRLPVDIVKIDQSFTARLGQRDGDALATTVVTLADELGLVVIAEGIETASQARALADLGCPFGQGYLFGRPVPGADVNLGANGGWARELGTLTSGRIVDPRLRRQMPARHLA